ncbi:hypothetical protein [Billgrantia montanilacus]|uniref:hypothetical protein n=1 Tax=Billgrantia montanilacus TaxID=2282305 RepID=UPI000DF3EA3D|nr:hypothetical protein [Halomonas montanilacus]
MTIIKSNDDPAEIQRSSIAASGNAEQIDEREEAQGARSTEPSEATNSRRLAPKGREAEGCESTGAYGV